MEITNTKVNTTKVNTVNMVLANSASLEVDPEDDDLTLGKLRRTRV